jgi:iron complex outermembrane receptor protein
LDRRLSFDVAAFYNDYSDFIINALAPAPDGGFVAVNLNAGKVRSYGAEVEASLKLSDTIRVYGNGTYVRARVVDGSPFEELTGYAFPKRLPFLPDWNFTVGVNAKLPIGRDQNIVADANYVYRGDRLGSTLDVASQPIMPSYGILNASLTYQTKVFDIAVFSTNLNNAKYQEIYLDASALRRAGLPDPFVQNLVTQGVRRRIGVRGTVRF